MFLRPLFISALGLALAAQDIQEVTSTAKDRTGLGITIYHNNLAVIRECRNLRIPSGPSHVAFADVAKSIQPKSVSMTFGSSLAAPHVLERNFEFNLLSPASAVDHSLGHEVAFRWPTGERLLLGRLVSLPLRQTLWAQGRTPIQRLSRTGAAVAKADSELLIKRTEGYMAVPGDHLVLREPPSELRSSPTLLLSINASQERSTPVEVTYKAGGFSWEANYVGTLSSSGKTLDLDAWITLTNRSGSDFQNAILQLVAGEPNQIWESPQFENAIDRTTTVEVSASAAAPPTFQEERLSEYHLFTLDRPTTLTDSQTKQVALFRAVSIPVEQVFIAAPPEFIFAMPQEAYLQGSTFNPPGDSDRIWVPHSYVTSYNSVEDRWVDSLESLPKEEQERIFQGLDWREKMKEVAPPIRIQARVRNASTTGLGRPMPKGKIQVLHRRNPGQDIWLSESQVEATPPGEDFSFDAGTVANMVAHRKVSDIHLLRQDRDNRIYQVTFEVRIQNRRRDAVKIQVREPIFAGWEILESSHPNMRVGTNAVDFHVMAHPSQETILHYRIQTSPTSHSFEAPPSN